MQTVTDETCTIFDRTGHLHLQYTFGALEDFKDKGKSQDGSYFFLHYYYHSFSPLSEDPETEIDEHEGFDIIYRGFL